MHPLTLRLLTLRLLIAALALFPAALAATAEPVTTGDYELGDFSLEGGQVLPHAKLRFATAGALNAAGDNAVLVPSWYSGTLENNTYLVDVEKGLDPARYFVVFTEMFGNRTEVMRTEQGKAKNKFQKDAGGIINVNGFLNKIQEGIFQAVANPAFLSFVTKSKTAEAGVNIVKKQGFLESGGDPESANGMAIVNITDLENSIVEVQKAIQSPPISMEGNKLNFRPARPLP